MLGRLGLWPLVPHVRAAAMIRRDAQRDPVKPGLERRASLELRKLPVHHDEDLLAEVFDVRFRNAEVTKGAPKVACVLVEDRAQRGRRTGFQQHEWGHGSAIIERKKS